MDTVSFFSDFLVIIFFFYGLSFFILGVAVWLESSRMPYLPMARGLISFAIFGLIHGAHEWVEMFYMVFPQLPALPHILRLLILAASFYILVEFGLRLLISHRESGRRRLFRVIILAIFLGGIILIVLAEEAQEGGWVNAVDAWCRYSLAIPGAVMSGVGLLGHSRRLITHPLPLILLATDGPLPEARPQPRASYSLMIVGLAIVAYGFPGQFIVGQSFLPPSNILHTTLFLETLHFPIQLVRTLAASLSAIFTVRALRIFEMERQRQIEELNQARLQTQQRLTEEIAERQALQRDLFRQVVQAQEEERSNIARELHDEIGQSLTALSWGLATVEESLPEKGEETGEQVGELRQLTGRMMVDLRQLTTDLRPSMLDELGLAAALITYADDCSARYPFVVDIEVTGKRQRLPSEIETTLYRIAQEALTNVAKHAQASTAFINLQFTAQEIILNITDDGVGMDVEATRYATTGGGWGLAGIFERAQLADGHVDIESAPNEGTTVTVTIPVPEGSGSTTGARNHETDSTTTSR